MRTTIINKADDWSFWTETERELLLENNENINVGEKLVYENETIKIWSIHLKPNKSLPFHKHNKRYLWTALSEGIAKSYHNDGNVTETIYEIGDTKCFEDLSETNYFIHNLINTGKTTLIFTTIEFKK